METELFDESWIGKVISFTEPNARWRLTEKLRDKNDQFSAGEINDFPDAVSGAYGTFECENVDCHTDLAIMRIAMQYDHPLHPPTWPFAHNFKISTCRRESE